MYLFLALLVAPFFAFRPKDPFQPEFIVNCFFIIMIGLGPAVLYFLEPQLYAAGNYSQLMPLIAMSFLAMNSGFLVCRVARRSPAIAAVVPIRPWQGRRITVIAWVLVLLSIVASALFYARAGGVPMLDSHVDSARVSAMGVRGNGYLLYLMTLGMVAVLLLAVSQWLSATAGSRFQLFLFLGATAAIAAVLLGTGSRRFTLWVLLYAVISFHYYRRRLTTASVVGIGIFALAAVNLFEMVRSPDSDTTATFGTALFYRLIVYAANLEKVFSAFMVQAEPMYGQTFFMDLLTALPGAQVDYQTWVKQQLGLDFEGFGVPPTLIGDFYINFGTAGVLIGSALYGFFSCCAYRRLIVDSRLGALSVVLYVLLLEAFLKVLTSGLSAQLISFVWVGSVFTLLVVLIKARIQHHVGRVGS